jgi:hypothetical protein
MEKPTAQKPIQEIVIHGPYIYVKKSFLSQKTGTEGLLMLLSGKQFRRPAANVQLTDHFLKAPY